MKRTTWLLLLAAGCISATDPVEPAWGKQPCSHCMMLVSERDPAAQLLLADGTRHFFDDVGCMVSFVDQEKLSPKAEWVHLGNGWWPASKARFAKARTPMDFGYVAATEGITFDEVKTAVRQKLEASKTVMP